MKIKYSIVLLIVLFACKSEHSTTESIDPSYAMHVNEVLSNEALNFSNVKSIGIQLENQFSFDNKLISKEELLQLERKDIFHIFLNHQYDGQRDTPRMVRKFQAFSFDYYDDNKLEPAYLNLNFYDGNLTGLNLGSETKGELVANVYDINNGKNLSSFNKSNFNGVFYLGSNTAYDTFQNVRLVLKVDSLLFSETYTKEEMLKN